MQCQLLSSRLEPFTVPMPLQHHETIRRVALLNRGYGEFSPLRGERTFEFDLVPPTEPHVLCVASGISDCPLYGVHLQHTVHSSATLTQ